MLIYFFQGLLITGGLSDDGDAQHTAEVWLPGDRSCLLPSLPSPGRYSHTQSSYTACGGEGKWDTNLAMDWARTSCLTFIPGEWEHSHSLTEQRYQHVSWQSPAGTLLIGGAGSITTELLSNTDTTTTPGFNLNWEYADR